VSARRSPSGAALQVVRRAWDRHPLALVMAVAAVLRLAAALLSRGYAFHDDHFEVVEVAQHWVDGLRDWLGRSDSFRSLLYPGLHWALFSALQRAGVGDPQTKMLVVRLLHAAWSLLTVYGGYRIAERLAGRDAARLAGLVLAAFWLLPFASVHDLVEVACQPPLVLAILLLVRTDGGPRPREALLAGLLLGLAFAIRFQTAVFSATGVLLLLLRPRRAPALLVAAGGLVGAALFVGIPDAIGYGRPFSSVLAYVRFNSDPREIAAFPQGPWYQYVGTLLGWWLLPPASLLLAWGAIRGARRLPLLAWPTLAFLAFHSLYPGKQERFLLPVLPMLLVLCVVGARALEGAPGFWGRHPRVVRGLWRWFWVANAVLLALYTTNYSKRTRVEPLSYLYGVHDARGVVVETSEASAPFVPTFYLGRPLPVLLLPARKGIDAFREELAAAPQRPNYVVLLGEPRLEARLERLRAVFPRLVPVATFEPSFIDGVAHRLNPRHNVNLTAYLYRSEEPGPSAAQGVLPSRLDGSAGPR
jgi:hypothetical protein